MTNKTSSRDKLLIYFLLIIVILFFIIIGYNLGYEAANPCVEYSTDCEIICSGEGTPAYDCFENCPCLENVG